MRLNTRLLRNAALTILGALFVSLTLPLNAAAEDDEGGSVYVLGNQQSGNTVIVFHRNRNGSLVRAQEVSTHGLGSGGTNDPLGSQGALTLGPSGRLLLAVNAGSNEISALTVGEDGVRFASKIASGGERPVSVAVHGSLVYVLNAGGTPNVAGFTVTPSGTLHALPKSTRLLAGGASAAPAEVQFSPDGDLLLVTEKGTNIIDVFALNEGGRIWRSTSRPSNGATPFGFSFGRRGTIVVSEAQGGAPGGSSLSSYQLVDEDADADDLKPISKSISDTQTAACWVVIPRGGRVAFTSNTGSGTISSFDISNRGQLSLTAGVAADLGAGSGVIDMALSHDNKFLFVLSSALGTITSLRVQGDRLVPITTASGLPVSIQGIAAQ